MYNTCSPGCAIDLSAIAQELPNKYKVHTSKVNVLALSLTHLCNQESMKEENRRNFEHHFRTATYHSFTEIMLYKKEQKLFEEIGIQR